MNESAKISKREASIEGNLCPQLSSPGRQRIVFKRACLNVAKTGHIFLCVIAGLQSSHAGLSTFA